MSLLSRFFCLSFVTLSLLTPALAHAQGMFKLENPGDGQHYSGIGVISGWHCLEGRLTVRFNGGNLIGLEGGGERTDTQGVCGHTDTGFGSITNWALLGAGTHTAVVYRDGVEFARSTFTVGTTADGREYLEGVQGQKSVRDFPREGETTELEWNEKTQHFEVVSPERTPVSGTGTQSFGSNLENPRHGQNYSGIGVISGWKCSAVDLTAFIGDVGPIPVLYGNDRADTQGVCGDRQNGFVSPWNWGINGAGTHTIVLYDQGVEFARSTFTVGATGDEFVRGVSREITVFGFPYPLDETDFVWNQQSQHFEMLGGPGSGGGGGGGMSPSFGAATIADQGYTQGTAIPSLTLPQATGGTAPLVYRLSPALPAGLNFNQTTRVLSGTPTSTIMPYTYTYTVADGAGATASLSFRLTVSAQTAAPSFGAATIADQSYTQNTAIPALTLPQATGGAAPLMYSLSPALPAGLSFNQVTRQLAGTPTSTLAATTYTYMVADGSGATAMLSFHLSVEAPATPSNITNTIGMEMVLIPAGTFQMGSPPSEPNRYPDEGPVHQVRIGQAFYLGKHEVTQAEWRAVMGTSPSRFTCNNTCPVEWVSWDDIQGFIEELNLRESVTTYRLPSEAEWEYAVRAGTQTAYSFGAAENRLGSYAWYADNANRRTHPVGEKRPNGFGLYDMHGNVGEWVQDCWNRNYGGALTDGSAWLTGDCSVRVLRGGSWNNSPGYLRSAIRGWVTTVIRYSGSGFRLARSLN